MAKRLPVPKSFRELAVLVAEYHTHCHREADLKNATVLKVLEKTDAFRRPERFEKFLLACEADARGRAGLEEREYPQADVFRATYAAANDINTGDIAAANEVSKIPDEIRKARIAAIRDVRTSA